MFNCRICGKEYDDLVSAMNCERKCYEKQKEAEENKKKEKLIEEKEMRKVEVEKAFKIADSKYNEAVELEKKYEKDYGLFLRNNPNNVWFNPFEMMRDMF